MIAVNVLRRSAAKEFRQAVKKKVASKSVRVRLQSIEMDSGLDVEVLQLYCLPQRHGNSFMKVILFKPAIYMICCVVQEKSRSKSSFRDMSRAIAA